MRCSVNTDCVVSLCIYLHLEEQHLGGPHPGILPGFWMPERKANVGRTLKKKIGSRNVDMTIFFQSGQRRQ
jgi:hypothetical protein